MRNLKNLNTCINLKIINKQVFAYLPVCKIIDAQKNNQIITELAMLTTGTRLSEETFQIIAAFPINSTFRASTCFYMYTYFDTLLLFKLALHLY